MRMFLKSMMLSLTLILIFFVRFNLEKRPLSVMAY